MQPGARSTWLGWDLVRETMKCKIIFMFVLYAAFVVSATKKMTKPIWMGVHCFAHILCKFRWLYIELKVIKIGDFSTCEASYRVAHHFLQLALWFSRQIRIKSVRCRKYHKLSANRPVLQVGKKCWESQI